MLWLQKSKERWVKLGDHNTIFFHTQIVVHRRRGKISGLFIDDYWCNDSEVLQREALSFIKDLFCGHDQVSP